VRIISPKFKDYYDMVAGQGVDLTRIYMRETKEVSGRLPLPDWDERENSWDNKHFKYPRYGRDVYKQGWATATYNLSYIYVLFAGKLYGGLRFTDVNEVSHIWDVEALDAVEDKTGIFTDSGKYSTYRYRGHNPETEYEQCKRILAIRGDEVLSEWAIANSYSVVVDHKQLRGSGYPSPLHDNKVYLVDPPLKDFQFQKVIDPFTAYQELDMWVGGVLGQNKEPLEVSDSVKIQQHGFDKWSFRKHKLDNK
jgi:hypothetical protein